MIFSMPPHRQRSIDDTVQDPRWDPGPDRPETAVAEYPLMAGSSRSRPQTRRRQPVVQRLTAAWRENAVQPAACGRPLPLASGGFRAVKREPHFGASNQARSPLAANMIN